MARSRLRFGFLAACATVWAGFFAACSSDDSSGGGTTGLFDAGSCISDLQCDDGNPCTLDSCGEGGLCVAEPQPDGPALEQEPGDCSRTECTDGVRREVPDSGDPADDDDPCTLDRCEDGVAVHDPKVEGASCEVGRGNGSCFGGNCIVLCTSSNEDRQCDDENECTEDACVPCDADECMGQGLCTHSGLSGMAIPGEQVDGDCSERRCVEGKEQDVVDNFDIPEDSNECTEDVCEDGIPLNKPVTTGTPCLGGICRSDGECVECISSADCTDDSNPCREPTCDTDGRCDSLDTPDGTPLPADQQTDGDCRIRVCNGSGSVRNEDDDTDVDDDNNPCTADSCSNGSEVHTQLPAGTPCGGGNTCTASGTCCTPTTCAAAGRNCGSMSDGCGMTLDCGSCPVGDSCSSGGVCRCSNGIRDGGEAGVDCGGTCPTKCANGTSCTSGGSCTSGNCVEGVCCNSPCNTTCVSCLQSRSGQSDGTCANITTGSDPKGECSPQSPSTCGRTGQCAGGACQLHPSGTACAAASCTGSTQTNQDTCDGSGTCVDGGSMSCGGAYICSGGSCQSCSDGVQNGNETGVDCGGGPPCSGCPNGTPCGSPSECATGNCVDGVCCATSCGGLCRRCDLSPNVGTCSFIPNGQDPDNECPGNNDCNGAGGC